MQELHQSTSNRLLLKAYSSSDHISEAEGVGLTVVISKNGGSFGTPNAGGSATEVDSGWYYVDLNTTDTNTLGQLIVRATNTAIDPVERVFQVVPATNRGMTALPAYAVGTADGLPALNTVIDDPLTFGGILKLTLAALAGNMAVSGTSREFSSADGQTVRIAASIDVDGSRGVTSRNVS